jgi:hypothetical protein
MLLSGSISTSLPTTISSAFRNLTLEQRQAALIELIARTPKKSDRQIAKQAGVDHKTIAKARAKGVDVGNVPHVSTRIDTKGRKQPAGKKSVKRAPAKSGALKLTRHDVLGWFNTAPDKECQRVLDGLGSRKVATFIPPSWDMMLFAESVLQVRDALALRRDAPALRRDDGNEDGLDTPSFLRLEAV